MDRAVRVADGGDAAAPARPAAGLTSTPINPATATAAARRAGATPAAGGFADF
eukprot:gene29181-1026_t